MEEKKSFPKLTLKVTFLKLESPTSFKVLRILQFLLPRKTAGSYYTRKMQNIRKGPLVVLEVDNLLLSYSFIFIGMGILKHTFTFSEVGQDELNFLFLGGWHKKIVVIFQGVENLLFPIYGFRLRSWRKCPTP